MEDSSCLGASFLPLLLIADVDDHVSRFCCSFDGFRMRGVGIDDVELVFIILVVDDGRPLPRVPETEGFRSQAMK